MTFVEARRECGAATVDRITQNRADVILFYGQSNAGASGDSRPILTTPVFPDRIMTFRSRQNSYGTQLMDSAELHGLGTVQDHPKYPPFPATAMAYALGEGANAGAGPALFMYTVWYGGQPLTSFLNGTTSWSNLTLAARRIPEVLLENDMQAGVTALVLIQGEAGPPGREKYAQVLNGFLDDTLRALTSDTGQIRSPIAILVQTNASNVQSGTAQGVALGQWDVARARPHDTVLAGPTYQCPLSDSVHHSSVGRMMLGDQLALAFETRVQRNEIFEPLHPVEAHRLDSSIVIAFKRPRDSLPLQWDQSWITPVPNYGFHVEASNNKAVAISEVAITGPSEIIIHLERESFERKLTVNYAISQPQVKGWAPGRGQLIAPTTRGSAFARLGARLPATVNHYAIRFKIAVG